MAADTQPKIKQRRPKTKRVLHVVGGIDPTRTYSLPEFRAITGITSKKLSLLRRQHGLIVRDAGTPTILGQDWIDFVGRQPAHIAKQGRRPPVSNEATA